MKKVHKKQKAWGGKRAGAGRPATGKDPILSVRIPAELIAKIERLAKSEGVSRGEKVRELIEKSIS